MSVLPVRSARAIAVGALCGCLAACAGAAAPARGIPGTVALGALSNGAAKEITVTVPTVAAIRAELPPQIRNSGTLRVGFGSLPVGAPPLTFVGSDQSTLTGSEPDLGQLVAAVFGLTPQVQNATWENLFVGIDSGRIDVGLSNITDTEARKQKYDFACYRKDDVAIIASADSSWEFAGNFANLAGRTIAVDRGTNQEKLLLQWQNQLRSRGQDVTVKYFPDINSTYLALRSGKIDGYFAPAPSIAYHVTQTARTGNPTRNAGSVSGGGTTLQGLICATSKKDSGLAKPLADAINYLIQHGQYQAWLTAWHIPDEGVPNSTVNPPGLPVTNS